MSARLAHPPHRFMDFKIVVCRENCDGGVECRVVEDVGGDLLPYDALYDARSGGLR